MPILPRKSQIHKVIIYHLDRTFMEIPFTKHLTCQVCLEKAANKFKIFEYHYFGLKFKDINGNLRWLRLNKPFKKQLEKFAYDGLNVIPLYLEVQFYPHDINKIEDDVTRYVFYLQLKNLILDGQLDCELKEAIQLAAFSLQAEHGSFDSEKFSPNLLRDYNLLPERHCYKDQLDNLLTQISMLHQKHINLSPNMAESYYLNLVQQLENYGKEKFHVHDADAIPMFIGACSLGIFIMTMKNDSNNIRCYLKWENLRKLSNKDKYFVAATAKETILFKTHDVETAKYIVWCISSQHEFYLNEQGQNQFSPESSLPSYFESSIREYPNNCRYQQFASQEALYEPNNYNYLPSTISCLQHASSTLSFQTRSQSYVSSPELSRYNSEIIAPQPQTYFISNAPDENSHNADLDLGPPPVLMDYDNMENLSYSSGNSDQILEFPYKLRRKKLGEHGPSKNISSGQKIKNSKVKTSIPILLRYQKLSLEDETVPEISLPFRNNSTDSCCFNSQQNGLQTGIDCNETNSLTIPIIYEKEEQSPITNKNSSIFEFNNCTNNVALLSVDKQTIFDLHHEPIHKSISVPHAPAERSLSICSATTASHKNKYQSPSVHLNYEKHYFYDPAQESNMTSSGARRAASTRASIIDDPTKQFSIYASIFAKKHELGCSDEFCHSPSDHFPACVARKPENTDKNKFKNAIPYDFNRVKLNPNHNSEVNDYINASLIEFTIKTNKHTFIATQNPLAHTCTDFWQMVWENNVKIIVMLNNDIPDGISSSRIYFAPNTEVSAQSSNWIRFDQYHITTIHKQDEGLFVFRTFQLKYTPTSETKTIYHLHYLDWVGQSGPANPEGFHTYIDYIKYLNSKEIDPLLVHCNAGAGRTGVFLLIYILQEQINLRDMIEVKNTLQKLRKQRMDLVRTPEQYKFVYKAMQLYAESLLDRESKQALF